MTNDAPQSRRPAASARRRGGSVRRIRRCDRWDRHDDRGDSRPVASLGAAGNGRPVLGAAWADVHSSPDTVGAAVGGATGSPDARRLGALRRAVVRHLCSRRRRLVRLPVAGAAVRGGPSHGHPAAARGFRLARRAGDADAAGVHEERRPAGARPYLPARSRDDDGAADAAPPERRVRAGADLCRVDGVADGGART